MSADLSPRSSDAISAYVPARSLAYLSDNGLAHDTVDELRWHGKPHCPRCRSQFIKRVNTNVFRQLYRCIDCGYMYNSLSGTIFHGSKMPVYKHFHFLILHNAMREALSLRDICYALDVSHKTASLLLRRAQSFRVTSKFTIVDRSFNVRHQISEERVNSDSETFFSFCEMKGIAVHEKAFLTYLEEVMLEDDSREVELKSHSE